MSYILLFLSHTLIRTDEDVTLIIALFCYYMFLRNNILFYSYKCHNFVSQSNAKTEYCGFRKFVGYSTFFVSCMPQQHHDNKTLLKEVEMIRVEIQKPQKVTPSILQPRILNFENTRSLGKRSKSTAPTSIV